MTDFQGKGFVTLDDICLGYKLYGSNNLNLAKKVKAQKCSSKNVSTQYATDAFMTSYDTNKDGVVSAAEYAAATGTDVSSASYALAYLGGKTSGQISYQEVCSFYDQYTL